MTALSEHTNLSDHAPLSDHTGSPDLAVLFHMCTVLEFLILISLRLHYVCITIETEWQGPDHQCGPIKVRGSIDSCGPKLPSHRKKLKSEKLKTGCY